MSVEALAGVKPIQTQGGAAAEIESQGPGLGSDEEEETLRNTSTPTVIRRMR
jgi:hypothetical protein